MKYINLNSSDRFVKADILRDSYIVYPDSLNPKGQNFVDFEQEGFELGIVSGANEDIAKAVSSVLTCSLEDAKDTRGGHLPPKVVERVQQEIISPYGVSQLWGATGHRFVLSRPAHDGKREIIATILVARSKDTIFFFTGRYNNLRHSSIKDDVDLLQPNDSISDQRWFDRFAFPDLDRFKPKAYHQIANFVVQRDCRLQGLAKFLLDNIVKYYSRDYLTTHGAAIKHSQHLLCGRGFWQIGDPPWLPKMQALGFYLRGGAESFFIEQDWAPLPIVHIAGQPVSNLEYNRKFELPDKYQKFQPYPCNEHLLERIPEVVRLSQNPKAKLQYFQAMFNFS